MEKCPTQMTYKCSKKNDDIDVVVKNDDDIRCSKTYSKKKKKCGKTYMFCFVLFLEELAAYAHPLTNR